MTNQTPPEPPTMPSGSTWQPPGPPSQQPPPPYPGQPYPGYPAPAPRQNSGLAVASLVLGLVGLVVSWFTFGIPSLLALIFGIIGIRQTGDGPGKREGRGMAVAGTVLGAVILAFGAWVSAVLVYSLGSAVNAAAKSTAPTVAESALPSYPADGQQESTPPPPDLGGYTPRPADFKLTVKTLKKECFGDAGCNITYRLLVDYVGTQPLDSSKKYEVTYEVRGVEDGPQINTFTIENNQSTVDSEELASTPSSSTKLTAKATDVSAAS